MRGKCLRCLTFSSSPPRHHRDELSRPAGSCSQWLDQPAGCDSAALLPAAERAGVSYVPGGRFFPGGGGERYLRLAFSLLSVEALAEGARRLGDVLR